MRRAIYIIFFVIILGVACSNNDETQNDPEELPSLDVEFTVPETADPGDTVELIAEVTYDGEPVTEADEVLFEIWPQGDQDAGEKIDGENQGDGTYTLDYTFDEAGIYEMYAHTTAHSLHTMPKKQINVGDAEEAEHEEGHDHGFHTEGFDMHFEEPEDAAADEDTALTTHLTLNDEALEQAKVRYEIWPEADEDNIEWADAEEGTAGEYTGTYAFPESGTYHVQIHVQDDEDLHEHMTYEIEVKDSGK